MMSEFEYIKIDKQRLQFLAYLICTSRYEGIFRTSNLVNHKVADTLIFDGLVEELPEYQGLDIEGNVDKSYRLTRKGEIYVKYLAETGKMKVETDDK